MLEKTIEHIENSIESITIATTHNSNEEVHKALIRAISDLVEILHALWEQQ